MKLFKAGLELTQRGQHTILRVALAACTLASMVLASGAGSHWV